MSFIRSEHSNIYKYIDDYRAMYIDNINSIHSELTFSFYNKTMYACEQQNIVQVD